jgi:hypothetical protein
MYSISEMFGVDEMKYLRQYKAAYFCSGVGVTQSGYVPRALPHQS